MQLPKSRAEALRAGSSRYFTGKPCIHGHTVERKTSDKKCVVCLRWNLRRHKLKMRFGLTYNDYLNKHREQGGKCAICGRVILTLSTDVGRQGKVDSACLDHCHRTGKVRGLLCKNCNTGIGLLQESEAALKGAIKYLRKWQEKRPRISSFIAVTRRRK